MFDKLFNRKFEKKNGVKCADLDMYYEMYLKWLKKKPESRTAIRDFCKLWIDGKFEKEDKK